MSEAEKLFEEFQKIHAELKRLSDVLVDMIKIQEENLPNIVGKLDQILQNAMSTPEDNQQVAVLDCRKWSEFREASVGASLVAFEMDIWNIFCVTSRSGEFIFRYSEKLPISKNDVMPEDSICHKVLNLDIQNLRRWLSRELKVTEDKIIQGNLETLSEYTGQHGDNVKRDNIILEYYKSI